MIEVRGNMWKYPADVYVITTNGFVKAGGECVMGRGCAMEARDRFPGIAKELGGLILEGGNYPYQLKTADSPDKKLWSFPVKHNWWEEADIELIAYSAMSLNLSLSYMDYPTNTIVVPRPGCGNGSLDWEDVKPVLEKVWDDRYHVITF